jgi:sulfur-oxidizing protein SoxB
MGYRIDPHAKIGSRISDMTMLRTGKPIEAARDYIVAGWASVNQDTKGPPIWQVVEAHLTKNPVVNLSENQAVKITG